MRIFIAGATGALGRQLVPRLVANGHAVTGLTRSAGKQDAVHALGATPAVADALDADAIAQVVAAAEPDVVVHQLTAIPHAMDMRKFDATFAQTNRLRTTGTDHLLAAAQAVGARRFVAQSYAPAIYARTGGAAKREDDPLDEHPPEQMRATLHAIRHLEDAVLNASSLDGVVLRYGGFYGPGTNFSLGEEGAMVQAIRKRQVPLVGKATGVWSFIHVEDAAEATVAAIEGRATGVFNVVDDEPAPVNQWLPAAARAVQAPAPRKVPRWLGRLFAGDTAATMMTDARGALNEKAKRELGWSPRHASWRDGFATGL